MKKTDCYWIYMLECENGSYYTGYTNDMVRRYRQHIDGTGKAKYTHSFKPVRIAQCWRLFDTKGNALKVELLIKGMDRGDKDLLVENPDKLKTTILEELELDLNILTFDPLKVEKIN